MQSGSTLLRFLLEGIMKAYSLDFREKIIDAYFMERMSVRNLAKRFRVAKSFV
jgi:transposase